MRLIFSIASRRLIMDSPNRIRNTPGSRGWTPPDRGGGAGKFARSPNSGYTKDSRGFRGSEPSRSGKKCPENAPADPPGHSFFEPGGRGNIRRFLDEYEPWLRATRG